MTEQTLTIPAGTVGGTVTSTSSLADISGFLSDAVTMTEGKPIAIIGINLIPTGDGDWAVTFHLATRDAIDVEVMAVAS